MIQVTLAASLAMTMARADASPCNVTSQFAICNNQSIVKIPQDLPYSITALNLNYNRIESTITRDLQRYRQLKHLYIRSNQIRSVDEEAFLTLSELSYVDLSFNGLTNISNYIFRENIKLVSVVLNENKLWFDPAFPFLISSSIEHLELEKCGIWQISSVTFSKMEKLKMLSVSDNNILSLDPAAFHYNSLQELYIDPAQEIKSTLNKLCCDGVILSFSGIMKRENVCKGWTGKMTRKVDPQAENREETLSSQVEAESTTQDNTKNNKNQTICLDRTLLLIIAPIALIVFIIPVVVVLRNFRKENVKNKGHSWKTGEKCNSNMSEPTTSPDCEYILVEDAPVHPNAPQRQPLAMPSEDAPQRPLPPLPSQYLMNHATYNEYEKVNYG